MAVVKITINAEISHLDSIQIVLADLMQRSDFRASRTRTRGLVRDWYSNLGKAAGLQAQIDQVELMQRNSIGPDDYQRYRIVAQAVTAEAFRWAGETPERSTVGARLSFQMAPFHLSRLITARVLGWMQTARDREGREDWWQVSWRSALSGNAVRYFIKNDLTAYGLQAAEKAEQQIKLCTDSMPKDQLDLPRHAFVMCDWRVRSAYRLAPAAPPPPGTRRTLDLEQTS